MKKSGSLHGTLMNQKIVNQRGQKSQQLHPRDQRRGYSEDIEMMPSLKYFLQNCRPVAKYYGHDVIEENDFDGIKYHAEENNTEDESEDDDDSFDGIKYHAEENDTEDESEDDDDSLIADPQHKLFMENLRPDGNFYVYNIIKDNVFVRYHDEPSSPEPEDPTVIVIDDANHVSNDANVMDTAMHSPVMYEGKHRCTKPKFPKLDAYKSGNADDSHVASEAQKHEGKRRGRKPKGQDLSAHKNPNGNASSSRLALEPQNHALNFKGKRRGRELKGGSNLLANKNPIGNSNQVTSEGHDHAVKCEDRERKWQDLSAEKNHNANANRNRVALEPQNHVLNYKGKHRGREPKGGSNLLANKNPIGNSNQVTSEGHDHAVKCEDRKRKWQDLSAEKNHNANASRNRVALEPQNHVLNYKGMHRGRKPKGGSNLQATKNQVILEAHNHAVKLRGMKAKKNVVPSADCQTIDHEIKTDIEDDDDDDVPPCRRRPVRYSTLNEKIFLDDDDEANAAKPTEFREKLMEELKKPYCQAEYDRLLKNITVRKPAQGQKVLRRGTKVYEEDHNAKSYLDHHIDLKRKMYEVRDDKHKLLNLLRGFFYWLVNVPHEWKFKPWKVQSCLDVLPQQQ